MLRSGAGTLAFEEEVGMFPHRRIGPVIWALSSVSILVVVEVCPGQGTDFSEAKKLAIRALDSVAQCNAGKIKAKVWDRAMDASIVYEFRGRSIWITGTNRVGWTDEERKEHDRLRLQLAKVWGHDGKFIDAFDGNKQFSYAIEEMYIKKASYLTSPCLALDPSAWVCFHRHKVAPMEFKSLLDDSTPNVSFERRGPMLRVTHRTKIEGFQVRWMELDPAKDYLVARYDVDGGKLGHLEGTFEWRKTGEYWYAAKGSQSTSGHLMAAWEITDISFDAADVRPSFTVQDRDLPFATMIRDSSDPKKEIIRYVGGEEGKAEHAIRKAAAHHVRQKSKP